MAVCQPCDHAKPEEKQPLTLTEPDDWHHHFRDGDALRSTVPYACSQFARAIAMPNLVPPVTTTQMALEYRDRILRHVPDEFKGKFQQLMTLYLTDDTSPAEIEKAKKSGHVYAVKLYPRGATTKSHGGVTAIEKIIPTLKAMEEVGVVCIFNNWLLRTLFLNVLLHGGWLAFAGSRRSDGPDHRLF